jgi:hypothetical protein
MTVQGCLELDLNLPYSKGPRTRWVPDVDDRSQDAAAAFCLSSRVCPVPSFVIQAARIIAQARDGECDGVGKKGSHQKSGRAIHDAIFFSLQSAKPD